jgi:hypothetical protein
MYATSPFARLTAPVVFGGAIPVADLESNSSGAAPLPRPISAAHSAAAVSAPARVGIVPPRRHMKRTRKRRKFGLDNL